MSVPRKEDGAGAFRPLRLSPAGVDCSARESVWSGVVASINNGHVQK